MTVTTAKSQYGYGSSNMTAATPAGSGGMLIVIGGYRGPKPAPNTAGDWEEIAASETWNEANVAAWRSKVASPDMVFTRGSGEHGLFTIRDTNADTTTPNVKSAVGSAGFVGATVDMPDVASAPDGLGILAVGNYSSTAHTWGHTVDAELHDGFIGSDEWWAKYIGIAYIDGITPGGGTWDASTTTSASNLRNLISIVVGAAAGTTPVEQSTTVTYDVDAEVEQTITVTYDVLAEVEQTTTVDYEVLAEVEQSIVVVYDVLAEVEQSTTITYDVLAEVEQSTTVVYDVAAEVEQSIAVVFDVLAEVEQSTTVDFEVRAEVEQSTAIVYDVASSLTEVQQSIAVVYDVLAEVEQSTTITYDVLAQIEQATTVNFDVAAELEQSTTIDYDVLAEVEKSTTVDFDVAAELEQSTTVTYDVLGEVEQSTSLIYDIVGELEQSTTIVYAVESDLPAGDVTIDFYATTGAALATAAGPAAAVDMSARPGATIAISPAAAP